MKIAYNPITELPLLSIPLDIDITFDLPGKVIYARGVRFLGTDTTYEVFKKHTDIDDTGGYSGLVPAPSYTKTIARFLREDGNWVALAGITPPDTELDIDSTNSVENRVITTKIQELILDINGKVGRNQIVTASEAGLAPKIGTSCETTINALTDEWVLASTKGGEPTWRKLPLHAFLETRLYVGEKDEPNNSATANGNTYLKLFDNTTLSNLYNIKGLGRTTVTTDSSGNITITTPDTISWDSITNKPETFTPSAHTHSTSHIINLAEYAKAETRDALSITDTLNQALGKLEYKADLGVTAYDWYKGVTAEDTDDIINKWHEIVDFIDSVAEGTDITDEFVTRKTPQTIIGQKTFSLSEEPLIIHRASDIGASYIRYKNNETLLGDIGIGGSGSTYPYDVYFNDKNLNPHKIWHSGNSNLSSVDWNASKLILNTTNTTDWNVARANNTIQLLRTGSTMGNAPTTYSSGISIMTSYTGFQLATYGGNSNILFFRSIQDNNTWLSWRTVAFTDSDITGNAATATKLATARTIWGQSFDGSANVSGNLSGVGAITRSNVNAVDVDEYGNLKFKSTNTTDNWSVKTNGGVQVLSVYNSGNVGIGTTNPTAKLHIVSSSAGADAANSDILINGTGSYSTWHRVFTYNNSNLTAGAIPNIYFGALDSKYNGGYIGFKYVGKDSSSNYVTIGLYAADNLVSILGNGNVGIGTTSPSYKLHVNGSLNATTIYQNGSPLSSILGNYLPLTGGTLTGKLTIGDANNTSWMPIHFNRGSKVGFVGMGTQMEMGIGGGYIQVAENHLKYVNNGTSQTIYHSGNLTKLSQLTNDSGFITSSASISGNAATATKLATARTIWGQSFDGTRNVSGDLSSVGIIQFSNEKSFKIRYNGFYPTSNSEDYWWGVSRYDTNVAISVAPVSGVFQTRYATYLATSSGNVGIGTTNPLYKLHVLTTSNWAIAGEGSYAAAYMGHYTGHGIFATTKRNTSDYYLLHLMYGQTTLGTGGSTAIIVKADGNVGIGTTSPSYKLDVNGAVRVGNNVANGVLLNFNMDRPWYFYQEGSGSTSALVLQSGTSDKYFHIKNDSGSNIASFFASSESGNRVGVNGVFEATTIYQNGTSLDSLLGAKLNSSSYTASDVLAKLKTVDGSGSGLDADLLDGVDSINYLRCYSRGSIGTSPNFDNPSFPMSFFERRTYSETTGQTGTPPPVAYAPILSMKTPDSIVIMQIAGRGEDWYIRGNHGSNVTLSNVSWNQIALTTSNVASATKLQTARTIWGQSFDGTGNVSGNLSNVGNITTNSSNTDIYLQQSTDSRSWWTGIGISSGDDKYVIYDATAKQHRLSIDTSGKVGIGTTNPAYKLDVNGNLRVNSTIYGCLAVRDANGNWIVGKNDSDNGEVSLGSTAKTQPVTLRNSAGSIYLNSSGNVGIGTTSPSYKLDVNGSFRTSSLTFTSSNTISFDANGNIKLSSNSGTYWHVDTSDGSNVLTAHSNGNVGIGTISPSYKLHVNGSLNATTIYQNGTSLDSLLNTKLNSSSYTAADVLAKLKTVDGSGSGLDADTVDNKHASYFHRNHRTDITNLNTAITSDTVTFDVSSPTGGPGGWVNCFSSIHNNYLSSFIANEHRTNNWWVGWVDNSVSSPKVTWRKIAFTDLIPTNTWRPVTNTYTGSDQSTCVSQYGTNALYNALVNGYASSAGNADKVDGVHLEWAGSQAASDTTWLAGWTADGTKIKAVKRADLSVNYANSAGSVAWGNITGKPSTYTPASHTHTLLSYDSTTTFGENCMLYKQTDSSFDGNSGWSHYLVFNHGNGATYYHYNVAFPFLGPPKYKRLTGSTSSVTGWYTLISTENIGSQSVNYATSAGSVAWANVTGKPSFFSGNYNDLTNKPTIPSVGNGTITITQGGTTKGTFTLNLSGSTTIALTDNNTWRPVTNSYSGTATDTSLSLKGANDLYNALVNGYASSAGNADTVDNYHIAVQSSVGTNSKTIYFVI